MVVHAVVTATKLRIARGVARRAMAVTQAGGIRSGGSRGIAGRQAPSCPTVPATNALGFGHDAMAGGPRDGQSAADRLRAAVDPCAVVVDEAEAATVGAPRSAGSAPRPAHDRDRRRSRQVADQGRRVGRAGAESCCTAPRSNEWRPCLRGPGSHLPCPRLPTHAAGRRALGPGIPALAPIPPRAIFPYAPDPACRSVGAAATCGRERGRAWPMRCSS
jgi:hypothetical protein